MKRIALLSIIFVLCLAYIGQVSAQRRLPGQKGVQLTASSIDGYLFDNKKETAFSGELAISNFTKNGNHTLLGIEYLEKRYNYKDISIPVSQFTAEGGYYCNFLSNSGKDIFFSVGLSAIGGYETSNWGKKLLFDGATIQNEDAFIYGGSIGLEIETFLSDRIIFLSHIRERVLYGSTVRKFHTQIGCGLKFIL